MPICYFNNDYTKEYQCTYSEFKDSIEVNIEYDIEENEIEEIDGARIISATTEYANRDILILDNIRLNRYIGDLLIYSTLIMSI